MYHEINNVFCTVDNRCDRLCNINKKVSSVSMRIAENIVKRFYRGTQLGCFHNFPELGLVAKNDGTCILLRSDFLLLRNHYLCY